MLTLVALAVVLTARRGWRAALRLSPARVTSRNGAAAAFGLSDLVLPALWYVAISGSLHSFNPAPRSASSAPASAPRSLSAFDVAAHAVTQFTTIAAMLAIVRIATGGSWRDWGLRRDRLGRDGAWAVAGYVACWPAIFAVVPVTECVLRRIDPTFTPLTHSALTFLHNVDTPRWAGAVAIVSAAVLAPMMEEFFFRGLVQTAVAQHTRSAWFGIAVSSVLFGLTHLDVKQHVPALMLFGAVLGYVYFRTGSLTAAVLLHAAFNVKTLLFLEWFGVN